MQDPNPYSRAARFLDLCSQNPVLGVRRPNVGHVPYTIPDADLEERVPVKRALPANEEPTAGTPKRPRLGDANEKKDDDTKQPGDTEVTPVQTDEAAVPPTVVDDKDTQEPEKDMQEPETLAEPVLPEEPAGDGDGSEEHDN